MHEYGVEVAVDVGERVSASKLLNRRTNLMIVFLGVQ